MNKNKLLVFVVLFLLPITIISFLVKSKKEEIEKEKQLISNFEIIESDNKTLNSDIKINVLVNNEKTELNLEEYIIGVLAGEMPASFESEALKAQAVAARTYAMYKINNTKEEYDVIDTINDQVYLTKEEMQTKWEDSFNEYYNKLYNAVSETQNLVLKQNGNIIKAFFFSMSNGYTEDSITVFSEGNINGVESKWDNETLENFEVTTLFTTTTLQEKLGISDNINMEIISRSETNRVTKVKVNDKEYTGIEFRKLLTLRSTDFYLEKTNEGYNITTKGNGHGVGMSQYGANGMAKEGYDYQEILKYYYNDIEITSL